MLNRHRHTGPVSEDEIIVGDCGRYLGNQKLRKLRSIPGDLSEDGPVRGGTVQ